MDINQWNYLILYLKALVLIEKNLLKQSKLKKKVNSTTLSGVNFYLKMKKYVSNSSWISFTKKNHLFFTDFMFKSHCFGTWNYVIQFS